MDQQPALIPPAALEGLMRKVFVDRSVAAGLFWDALLKSHLFVPLAGEKGTGKVEISEDEPIQMLLGTDEAGKTVIWLFTSPEALVDYTDQDLPYASVASTALMNSFKAGEKELVLIGPEGLTLRLDGDLVRSLADGKVPEAANQAMPFSPGGAEQVYVGAPKDGAFDLEKRFHELFLSVPEVLEAMFIQIADHAGSRLLLGLRLENNSREELRKVAELVAKAAEGILDKGKTMDITLIDGSLKLAFQKWGKPFYKRGEIL